MELVRAEGLRLESSYESGPLTLTLGMRVLEGKAAAVVS